MTPEKYLCQWTFQFTLRCTQNLPGEYIQDYKGLQKNSFTNGQPINTQGQVQFVRLRWQETAENI